MLSLIKRLMCAAGIHSWGIYSWYPSLHAATLMCADCKKREWVYEGEAL